MRTYQVELTVTGAITIQRPIRFQADKELQLGNIFTSDVEIKKNAAGVTISVTVFTVDKDRAYQVALLFIGKMLDVLAIKINTALSIHMLDIKPVLERNTVRSFLTDDDFRYSFSIARDLNLNETKILRALNWYRKGLYTDDPFDKFLAFWNSICVVASGYHTPDERTTQGIINQIWNCFITLWGQHPNSWPVINGDANWVNDNNGIRNDIAHGLITIEINHITNVLDRLNTVQDVAYNFITQWSRDRLNYPLDI
jgi:hypothetical protein